MHFVIHTVDVDDPSIRQTHYPEHRAYLASAPLDIVIAGPLLGEDGETPVGSLLVVEADNADAVWQFASGDPFAVHKAWRSIKVFPFRMSVDNRKN